MLEIKLTKLNGGMWHTIPQTTPIPDSLIEKFSWRLNSRELKKSSQEFTDAVTKHNLWQKLSKTCE